MTTEITEELKHERTNGPMRAITNSEHQRRLEYFKKIEKKLGNSALSEELYAEIKQLDSFYETYQWHITQLGDLIKKYHSKTIHIKRIVK